MDKMDKILSILKESNNLIDYTKETALITDGLLDSLELMEIISELEDAFDIEIGMEEIVPENFNSAEAILKLVERLAN
jgi:acyl carrier protein